MSYLPTKKLSENFEVSLKTIYNYLHKHKKEIRTQKKFWKTFVHSEDFSKVFQNANNIDTNDQQEPPPQKEIESLWTSKPQTSNVQKEMIEATVENTQLKRYNSNLQEQVNKYAILLSEEKEEKKGRMEKYDGLQNKYHTQTESFSKERMVLTRKFYLVLGASIILTLLLIWLILPSYLQ